MMSSDRHAEVGSYLISNRYLPREMLTETIKAIGASGVVDHFTLADQLVNFIPPSLWTPDNAPAAAFMPDPDSHMDAWLVAAVAATLAPDLSVTIMTDCIRRHPAEMIQSMLTLANLTNGRAHFQIGSGEIKQLKPFGRRRREGLDRFEDLVKLFDAVWNSNGPIDFDGHHATWKNATLGGERQHRPHVMGLGSAPRTVDLATTYCDGLAVAAPMVWATPERVAEESARIRRIVEEKGRDPQAFKIGLGCNVLLHEDETVLERTFENPLIKFFSATFGRVEGTMWRQDGMEPPIRDDWRYFMHLLPHEHSPAWIDEIIANTRREHVEASWIWGSPAEVAAQFQAFIDAGVDWILIGDWLPLVLDPSDAASSAGRAIDVCTRLKRQTTGVDTSAGQLAGA